MLVKVFIEDVEQFAVDTNGQKGFETYIRLQEMINKFLNDYIENPVNPYYSHFHLPYRIEWVH